MKKQLNHLFQEYLKEVDYDFFGGSRYVFIFENEYGASVISRIGSYGGREGLWEIAVLKNDGNGKYNICYDSGITDDVIGYLSDEQVNEYLGMIKNLQQIA